MYISCTDINKAKFKKWKERSKNIAVWEKFIKGVKVRIGT
jgi:hypothetical protein